MSIVSSIFHPKIEVKFGLFDELLLLKIPSSPLEGWFNDLCFRGSILSKTLFPSFVPTVGTYRKEIPELIGYVDAFVVTAPATKEASKLLLYVFDNGYPIYGITNFVIGVINSVDLPITILPMQILNGERKDETACIKYPYCVECRVPKMRHSSLIVAVNTTRSDIVGISARAI